MTLEADVASNYAHGDLAAAIDQALVAAGKDLATLRPEDLAPVDEFHVGGREATTALFDQLGIAPGMDWLDLGSGLGGPARQLAARGARVTGIDLSAEYVAVAGELARRVGMADQVAFQQGSIAALPFDADSFDGASLLHVGMNIPDKAGLFAGVARVLRPGGVFAVYDVMRTGDGELAFPVPWSKVPGTSFVATPAEYCAALTAAGFAVETQRSRGEFALAFFQSMRARVAAQGPQSLGLNVVMGDGFPERSANMMQNIIKGLIAPTEIIARKPH